MVSFWPWSGDSNSPASFEKTLATLSTKITDSQTRLDRTRSSSRRVKVLSTIYLSFAYLVYAIILLVVVGYDNLGRVEWSILSSGPVLVYVVRKIFSTYYSFRIDSLSTKLKDQTAEREKTIQKLKDATKYDSTLKLIEKYGGETPKKEEEKKKLQQAQEAAAKEKGSPQQRTRMPPPATANIQRSSSQNSPLPQQQHPQQQQAPQDTEPTEEFAPNAFSHPPPPPPHLQVQQQQQQQQQFYQETHWYDRVFDVLLGEDESAAKNRIVLLCQNCRLVNGQAPPGTRTLAELGKWRCMACHATNGEEDEDRRIVEEVLAQKTESKPDTSEERVEAQSIDFEIHDESEEEGGVRRRKNHHES